MKRLYTDERFPNTQIENEGSINFRVLTKEGNQWVAASEFTSYEDDTNKVSETFARRRATSYFDRMAEFNLSDEVEDQQARSLPGKATDRTLNADDVLDAYERAKEMTDPGQREMAMQQVRRMSQELESVPQEVVSFLLE